MNIETQTMPDARELGAARIEATRSIRNADDWERLWEKSTFAYPFTWGSCWKQCVEYHVEDFAAEVGFFTDILGFPTNAAGENYFMFTSPDTSFFFAVLPACDEEPATPRDAIRLQFMIENILATTQELQERGITFESLPTPSAPGSNLYCGSFRTPNGIRIDLWGLEER